MTEHSQFPQSDSALDALVTQLVACGGALSQVFAIVAASQMAGPSAPDAPEPYVVLQELLRGALAVVGDRHPATEIEMASWLLHEITDAIYNEVLLVDEDEPDLGPPV